ncbi:MAG TPA: TIR domain-containing protein [Longimicrobium sp.]|nr:TIR domain-containing protein [Longimicrobium sp.]
MAEPTDDECLYFANPAFHPGAPVLATFGEYDTVVRIWDIDVEALLGAGRSEPATTVQYTTAKIVLVGDSGVGKTGLGWRLANGTYREHDSTHGQQFWVVNELGTRRGDGTQCEAVLWDLAGQPDYRVVHSLFLSDVDLALVLFDPANRQEPLSGPSFWLKQLRRDDGLCPALLVGARQDRGTPTLTAADLQAFCEQHEISGGFVGTSARTGEGIPGLVAAIQGQIRWDEMTATVATTSFKRIKDYVLSLKEDPAATGLLLAPAALRRALRATDPAWEFDEAEMMTAVRHLATHGYVTILRGSRGDTFILLAPDLLVNLASSFVLEARRNARGLGVLEEERLLRGDYPFPELARLAAAERAILLDATTVLFLERNLCFRESFNDQVFLVFPSLINERRPSAEEVAVVDDVSYRVKGAVENVYAMLVVLLGYTNTFTRTNQWQNQAQYQMGEGEVCGFRQTASPEGEIELVLLYGQQTPEYVRTLFQGLFERFLRRRDLTISRYHPVTCHACGERLARNVVLEQLRRDRAFSFCSHCGERLVLPAMEDLTRRPLHEEEAPFDHEQAIAVRRTAFEAALVRVKALLRDRGAAEERPTCFISYAWGEVGHERWVMKLAADLRNAGFDVLLDRWHNPPGSSVSRYIERIESSRYVVVAATPALREKYMTRASDPVVAAELSLINTRVRQPNRFGHTVIPLLRAGTPQTALTPMLEDVVSIDFTGEDLYFVNLFNLIWRMFELPFDNPLLLELQAAMSPSRP